MPNKPKGLYENIQAKRKRIKAGSGEKMRKPGSKGAPTAKAFKQAAKMSAADKRSSTSRKTGPAKIKHTVTASGKRRK